MGYNNQGKKHTIVHSFISPGVVAVIAVVDLVVVGNDVVFGLVVIALDIVVVVFLP